MSRYVEPSNFRDPVSQGIARAINTTRAEMAADADARYAAEAAKIAASMGWTPSAKQPAQTAPARPASGPLSRSEPDDPAMTAAAREILAGWRTQLHDDAPMIDGVRP